MKHIRLISSLLAAVLLLAALPVRAEATEEAPYLNVKSALLMDAESGDVLFDQGGDLPLNVAGMTVMMTALLAAEAVERGDAALTDEVTASSASHNDITADASIQNIIPGETMPLRDLLSCALVGGASEACNIIAEHIAGSTASFVSDMNKRAQELGCTNTVFQNTHGLPAEGHYSTAKDLARIAAAFTRHGILMDICSTVSVEIPATNIHEPRFLSNGNYILRTDYTRYYYSYAAGIKASYTEEAGHCLATAVKAGDGYVVAVLLGCKMEESDTGYFDIQSYIQAKKLFGWFYDNYSLRDVVSTLEPIVEVPVAMGEGLDAVVACATEGLALFLPNDIDIRERYTRSIVIYSQAPGAPPLNAPVTRGQTLGELTVTDDAGKVYGPYTLIANTDVAVSRYAQMVARVRETLSGKWFRLTLLGVLLLLGLYIAFVIRYNAIRARRRRVREQDDEGSVRTIPRNK